MALTNGGGGWVQHNVTMTQRTGLTNTVLNNVLNNVQCTLCTIKCTTYNLTMF